ncbi:TetR/AcrR family transcriptional regulator C-terminal domain-containing protein [Sphaerisporangium rubeum]|uniref:AcrR family transcriptional regulator n=1 Tax=Sphaerisporangium rubeum TaxID=321317 RepID=A0A7X0IIX9_9ACTN|nr:TetR/AcrR family transcriptional regulator C-terminal domain-containing protein [Sphaerisporangium rubeum]MBB6476026.1 AcrR family transcriptional regulator [Sphaerisporangium rubeum]
MTDPAPPYLRIADDLRRRITSGELRPGDRVPSARHITREWGVAIATAMKVLTVLRQDGLTTVRPGVGTVVAGSPLPRPARPASGRDTADLTRDRVVRAAIALADVEGMAELSMRRVANALGVATMSLYRHVPSKDDLVLLMIDTALGEETFPATRPDGWRARLELSTRMLWRLFHRHPWLAPAMSLTRPQLAPNALQYAEWGLTAFDGTDLDPEHRLYVHVMLFSYVRGLATALEPEAEAERETGLTNDEWMESHEDEFAGIDGTGALASFMRSDVEFDLDKLFEFGLARLLDGLQVLQSRPHAERVAPPPR